MQIKDLKEIIPINIGQVEVDATSLIEHYFFDKPGHSDYRTDSINFMTKQKINFHSTCNSAFNVVKKFVKISCPILGTRTQID
jgi:hypothetical protein